MLPSATFEQVGAVSAVLHGVKSGRIFGILLNSFCTFCTCRLMHAEITEAKPLRAVADCLLAARTCQAGPGTDASVGSVVQKTYRVLAKSSLWGVAFGAALEAGMIFAKGIDTEGFEDRAYRLHYHESQNRTDTFARVSEAGSAVCECCC